MADRPAFSVANAPSSDESAVWPASVRLEDGVFESRYRVIRSLGDGGMGEVVLAEHLSLGKRVAIKLMHPQYVGDESTEQRFIFETRAAARIHHDNVVGITDFGRTADGRMFFVMEYLEGEDLAKTLRREGPLPWRRAIHMTRHVVRAMGEAHRRGVIHRDIKPGNCFRVTVNGDTDFIKVLDFGLAKFFRKQDIIRGPVTQAGVVLGTPGYMAPELEMGLRPDPRVDLYSIGVLLVRLMTGKLADEGGLKLLGETEGVPPALLKMLGKALREDPDDRFQTADAMEEAIDYVIASTGAKRPITPHGPAGLLHGNPAMTGNPVIQAPARGLSQPLIAARGELAKPAIEARGISTPKGPPLAARAAQPERATQQISSGVMLASMQGGMQAGGRATPTSMPAVRATPVSMPAVRATPMSMPAVRATPTSMPAVRSTPTSMPAVRATPVSMPAVRGRTAPLPVVSAGPSVLRVILIALVVGALMGGVMAVWMHMSQETGATPAPAPQPAPAAPLVPAPVPVTSPAPAPVVETADAKEPAPVVEPEAAPATAAKSTKKRRARKPDGKGALGLKNPFEK